MGYTVANIRVGHRKTAQRTPSTPTFRIFVAYNVLYTTCGDSIGHDKYVTFEGDKDTDGMG